MAAQTTHYVRPGITQRVLPVEMSLGESFPLVLDLANYLGTNADTLSSVIFDDSSGSAATISSSPIIVSSDGIISAVANAVACGVSLVKVSAELVDGPIVVRYWHVRVTDPTSSYATDYQN